MSGLMAQAEIALELEEAWALMEAAGELDRRPTARDQLGPGAFARTDGETRT
jgi:hypothetical protein